MFLKDFSQNLTFPYFCFILYANGGVYMDTKGISLYWCDNNEFDRFNKFYYDADIFKTFGGERKDRMINASAGALIMKENTEIGFLLLIEEFGYQTYNVDIGILKKYRNQGYGKIALQLLREEMERFQLNYYIEVKADNPAANRSLLASGFSLCKIDADRNFYTLQREKR